MDEGVAGLFSESCQDETGSQAGRCVEQRGTFVFGDRSAENGSGLAKKSPGSTVEVRRRWVVPAPMGGLLFLRRWSQNCGSV